MNLPELGPLFMIGFEGEEASEELLEFIGEEKIGGVILFARNLKNKDQIAALIQTLQKAAASPLLVGVDHEGGRVFRLPAPFKALPSARELGDQLRRSGDHQFIRELAFTVGQELTEVGFNINFAPVLDVDSSPDNPIIGNRAFSSDPELVAEVAAAFCEGLHQAGLLSCGKHFPGHGDTKEDSHKTLPVVEKSLQELAQCEWRPFRALIAGEIPSLMSAHVLYPALDPHHCATLSKKICHDLLREEFGFQGVLFSDDLLMKGITRRYSVPEAAVKALHAGCDMLLVCRDLNLQRETLAVLRQQVPADLNRARLTEARARRAGLLKRLTKLGA